MRAARVVFALVSVMVIGAFATFVWPTLYRPIPILASPQLAGIVAVRQNRVTGEVEWLPALSDRWASGSNLAASSAPKTDDSGEELRRIAHLATLSEARRRAAAWSAAVLAAAVCFGLTTFSIVRSRRSRFRAT